MIHLNIVPSNIKKEIKLSNIHIFLKNIYSVIIILVSCYAIILLAVNLILTTHFIKTINETTQVTKNTENYTNDVRDINNLINFMDEIQNDSTKWSYFLEYLNSNISTDIALNRISINKVNNELILSGHANTRDSLILLKGTLENSKYIKNVNFPIKNLLEKNDINFEIKTEFKNYEFN